jgi:hypothetical protein
MSTVDRNFELRQLLKAYRKGLISDEVFEEQLCDLESGGPPEPGSPETPARQWHSQGKSFPSEQALLQHFLDELRAGESFGGEIFQRWQEVASHPGLRGTLRAISGREAMHGRILADRLREIGGTETACLPVSFAEATQARLASARISDGEKLREVLSRLPNAEAATAPLREVIDQIEDDLESRLLLELIVADEASTIDCLHRCAVLMGIEDASPNETTS